MYGLYHFHGVAAAGAFLGVCSPPASRPYMLSSTTSLPPAPAASLIICGMSLAAAPHSSRYQKSGAKWLPDAPPLGYTEESGHMGGLCALHGHPRPGHWPPLSLSPQVRHWVVESHVLNAPSNTFPTSENLAVLCVSLGGGSLLYCSPKRSPRPEFKAAGSRVLR